MTTPDVHNEELHFEKLKLLGNVYEAYDLCFRDYSAKAYSEWAATREHFNDLFAEAKALFNRLYMGNSSPQAKDAVGKEVNPDESDLKFNSPEYERAVQLLRRLEHDFRKEVECPAATRSLSRGAFNVYLELAQEERHAAKGRAFAFTLTRHFSNRRNILSDLHKAGFRVHWTIGCRIAKFSDPTFPVFDGKVRHGRRAVIPKEKKKSKGNNSSLKSLDDLTDKAPVADPANKKRSRGPCHRYLQPNGKDDRVPRAFTHLHGLAVPNDPSMTDPLGKLQSILGNSFLKRISAANPLRMMSGQKGKTTAIAEGLLAYAVYMAKNIDQPCPIKGLRRHAIRGSAKKLTKLEKSNLSPTQTRGEIEAYRKAKETVRVRLRRPIRGKQTWAYRHREAIWAAMLPPVYDYPATVILRDGFEYTLKPQWGSTIEHQALINSPKPNGKDGQFELRAIFEFICCEFTRLQLWQEHEADQFNKEIAGEIRKTDGSLTDKGISQVSCGIRKRDGKLSEASLLLIEEGVLDRYGSPTKQTRIEIAEGKRKPNGRLSADGKKSGLTHRRWTKREIEEITNRKIYPNQGGECELELLLHISRFRRVIEIGESPECPLFKYRSYSGAVRPHADNVLPPVP